MSAVIAEYGILLYITMMLVLIIGFSGVFYLAVLAVTFVFRETLRACGVFKDFVRWRGSRPIHPGTVNKSLFKRKKEGD